MSQNSHDCNQWSPTNIDLYIHTIFLIVAFGKAGMCIHTKLICVCTSVHIMYVSAADDDDVDGMDKAAVVVGGGGAVHKGERVVPVSWALYAAVVVAAIGSFNFGYFTGIM